MAFWITQEQSVSGSNELPDQNSVPSLKPAPNRLFSEVAEPRLRIAATAVDLRGL